MKTKKYDGSEGRIVLRGMVLNNLVCARVTSQWTPEGLFDSKWENLIGGLVVRYFEEYHTAPNGQLTAIFESWAETTTTDDATVSAAERFLQGVSDEQRELETPEFILDTAGRYFNRVKIGRELETAKALVDAGQIEEAQAQLNGMRRVQLGAGSYVQPLEDFAVIQAAFDKEAGSRRALVTYPEALGAFWGDSLCRGRLFSFLAPDKSGKSTWLRDFTYRAIRCRNRVAYFDVGDCDEEEVTAALVMRATGRGEYQDAWYDYPDGWEDDGGLRVRREQLAQIDPIRSFTQFRRIGKSPDCLRVAAYPSSSVSAADIDGTLEDWAREGWFADVVVLDYADILAAPKGFRDTLDQIDEVWKQLRRITQQRHCLMMTATQASALAYGEKGLLSKKHFSGRKTKLAHVNGMIGINVTEDQYDKQMSVLNWVVRRKAGTVTRKFVTVAGCFACHNPAILAR